MSKALKREDLFLIVLPFFLTAVIISGHYRILISQNPQAHSRPLITTRVVQKLKDSELSPVPPAAPFPEPVAGAMHVIPTSRKQLSELLALTKSQKANTLLLRVGMKLSPDGNIILTEAAESSEETLLRWAKKAISDAHTAGIHTYIALMFVEEPQILNPDSFAAQIGSVIERWSSMAQEYHVSFFDPGIILGHPSYLTVPPQRLQQLVIEIERKTREAYSGRIGIGLCCKPTQISTRGYNQLLLISKSGSPSKAMLQKARQDARQDEIDHIFLLELDTQRLSSIK